MNNRTIDNKTAAKKGCGDAESTLDKLLTGDCSKEVFCLLYSKLLEERLPGTKIEFTGDTALRVVSPSGKESTTYLDNLWLKFKGGHEDRREILERYVRFAASLNSPPVAITRKNIVATIKDSQYISYLSPEAKTVTEHLCGDIYVVYAVDLPETISGLGREEMAKAGVDESELRALAVKNLERILPPIERHGEGPWYLVTAGSDYVASLLLFEWLWEQFKKECSSDIVAVVPSRDVLLYTSTKSQEGLAHIKERAIEISETAPHAISSSLLIWKNRTWQIYLAQ
ncbi:MAG TPA: DUF1444 family protein [Terracidiphilus sp.]|nr:DUF1444 family protein [Terracidiphilus sp.]